MRQDQRLALAGAIYAARFDDSTGETATPWGDLPAETQAVWLRCADAAAAVESKRCASIARIHGHHALWIGLLPFGWGEDIEIFGRKLSWRISKAIEDSAK